MVDEKSRGRHNLLYVTKTDKLLHKSVTNESSLNIIYYEIKIKIREEINNMAELINSGYQGVYVTIGITGLPITITGQVCNNDNTSTVTLKLKDGKIVNIAESLIAFFF